jgi:hypothetical protein
MNFLELILNLEKMELPKFNKLSSWLIIIGFLACLFSYFASIGFILIIFGLIINKKFLELILNLDKMELTRSKKLSSWLTIIGFLTCFLSYFAFIGIILLTFGLIINRRTDRTPKQKILWNLPLILILLIALYLMIQLELSALRLE